MNSNLPSANTVLAINAFDGGSHHSFLRGLVVGSRNNWKILSGKPVHWKWRMRSSALSLAEMTRQHVAVHGCPDLVFCTDMLDLPTWRGLLNDRQFADIPVVNYFHESQWTYPTSPGSRVDHHFGYTNLLSAIASDVCVFNSRFHRDTFLDASEGFVRRMPDSRLAHDWAALRSKSRVIPPGFDRPNILPNRRDNGVPVIGWVSRWESDKRPDRFAALLRQLVAQGHDFQLVLLGARPADSGNSACESLDQIRKQHSCRILFDGFAASGADYWRWLSKMDFVVSTADHEFFGIAICEAMYAGVIPVVPNRLSYPDLAPVDCLYDSNDEAIAMLFQNEERRRSRSAACRDQAVMFDRKLTTIAIDELVAELIGGVGH